VVDIGVEDLDDRSHAMALKQRGDAFNPASRSPSWLHATSPHLVTVSVTSRLEPTFFAASTADSISLRN